jgi:hypothetical protein
MALVAGHLFVEAVHAELRLPLVIELDFVERPGRVTTGALLTELVFMEVGVASLATAVDPLVFPPFVAFFAGDGGMFPDQRERGVLVVIKRRFFEPLRRVTGSARFRELFLVGIHVAGVAIGCFREPSVLAVDMALLARDRLVTVGEIVPGIGIVLEREDRPPVGDVTIGALLRPRPEEFELAPMRVVVATVALSERRHLSDDRAVAPGATDLSVFPGQAEPSLVVVEIPRFPLARHFFPIGGHVAAFAERAVLVLMGVNMAVGARFKAEGFPGLLPVTGVTRSRAMTAGQGIGAIAVVIESESRSEPFPVTASVTEIALVELRILTLVDVGVASDAVNGGTQITRPGRCEAGLGVCSFLRVAFQALHFRVGPGQFPTGVGVVERDALQREEIVFAPLMITVAVNALFGLPRMPSGPLLPPRGDFRVACQTLIVGNSFGGSMAERALFHPFQGCVRESQGARVDPLSQIELGIGRRNRQHLEEEE